MLNIAQRDRRKTMVFILLLLAMQDKYGERAKRYGLSCERWSWNLPLLINQPPQVLLVAAEQCMGEAIKCYLQTLHHLSRLAQTVVNKAHLLKKHEHFCPCPNLLEFLGGIPIPIIIMTATWPRSLERVLFLKISCSSFHVLCQSTHRPQIWQQLVLIEDVKNNQALNVSVMSKIQALIPDLDEKDWMLLFCLSHNDCDTMAQFLGWMPYHSHISLEQRVQSMQMWKKDQIWGLACLSMLSCCLDYPHVRYVYHLDLPCDAVDYAQAIG
jgi:superfamily II DNA helicase RecQ